MVGVEQDELFEAQLNAQFDQLDDSDLIQLVSAAPVALQATP